MKKEKLAFIDLFCGIGGFRLALEKFGKEKVLEELLSSSFRWFSKIKSIKSPEVKKNSIAALRFTAEEVMNYFGENDVKALEQKWIKEYPELIRQYEKERRAEKEKDFLERGVMDLLN